MNCGFRSVVRILEIVNDALGGILGRIPSRNTIEDWVKKCGLDIYNHPEVSGSADGYAMVVDESMMMGSEKLLMTLGIPARHKGSPVRECDVSVLDMSVSSSWDSRGVARRLAASSGRAGGKPRYVISDNASIMRAGIGRAMLPHHRDISHSLGMFLERCYRDEADFQSYTKSMSDAQFRHNMRRVACLLPPRQRTIARFINMSEWVRWSEKMLDAYHRLSREERAAFAFVPAHASLIDELSEVMACVSLIERTCKHEGLSAETIGRCQRSIRGTLLRGNSRMRSLGEAISRFLREEGTLLEGDGSVHNNSSDILETTFGVYKQRKSPNKLYGVTAFILFMPAYARFSSGKGHRPCSPSKHLENVRLWQIRQWAREKLTENLVIKRREKLYMAV